MRARSLGLPDWHLLAAWFLSGFASSPCFNRGAGLYP